MCSIVGAAGLIADLPRKRQAEFHEFMSCLFTMAELRGRDAAGFWVWRNDHYVFEKRPIPAEDLIERSPRWKGLRFNPGSLYMMHTRAATDGDPNHNMNNHPHMGEHSVMIHNGMIWGHQSIVNQYNLNMRTDCDSEVLLRLAECKNDITEGLKFMYETASDSHGTDSIATAFIDRRNPKEILLSRNTGNPCYIYRSKRFNCTFFCSTEDIFERALFMFYSSKDPAIIGSPDGESINTHWLYKLGADNTVTKELLVSPQPYASRSYDWDEEDSVIYEDAPYIDAMLGDQHYHVSVLGVMTLQVEPEPEPNEDLADLEYMDSIIMPPDVELDLRKYISQQLDSQSTI